MILNNKVPVLVPGGMSVVFSEDVGKAHVLVETLPPGSCFLATESYQTLANIAFKIDSSMRFYRGGGDKTLGKGTTIPHVLKPWLAQTISSVGERISSLTSTPPLIPSGQLEGLLLEAEPMNIKLTRLGWKPLPFKMGIRKTVGFFIDQTYIRQEPQPVKRYIGLTLFIVTEIILIWAVYMKILSFIPGNEKVHIFKFSTNF